MAQIRAIAWSVREKKIRLNIRKQVISYGKYRYRDVSSRKEKGVGKLIKITKRSYAFLIFIIWCKPTLISWKETNGTNSNINNIYNDVNALQKQCLTF